MIHLDTHVVVWLYLAELQRFTPLGLDVLEREDLAISPMVLLELEYLREIGRLVPSSSEVLGSLNASLGLEQCPQPFEAVIQRALQETWTRDPFDRIISSQAAVAGAPLLTRDETIRRHCPHAFWD